MKRKYTPTKRRTSDDIIQVLKTLFREEDFDGSEPLPETFTDEWAIRLDEIAGEYFDALTETLNQGRLSASKSEADRSNRLWNKLLQSYPALSCLGTPEVTLIQDGGLETQGGSYYYGSQYSLEDEFELRCEIHFTLMNPETEGEYVYIGIKAFLDTDVGSTKVYFSEPNVSMTSFITIEDNDALDMMEVSRAIVDLLRAELSVGDGFFWEIKYKITNEFRRLAKLTKRKKSLNKREEK
jgi:hypothetical protein